MMNKLQQGQENIASPYADMIKLSATLNVQALNGCAVTVRPQYSGNTAHTYPNQVFTLDPANAVLSPKPEKNNEWRTDQTGNRKVTIKSGAKVTATMQ